MEPSDPDASRCGRRGWPCVVHGWGLCPNWVAPAHVPLSSGSQEEEVGGEEEDDECRILVVAGPIGAPAIRQMTRISIGPEG
jgi:hypothetical protein